MDLSLIFNELSRHPMPDRESARQLMYQFAYTVKEASEKGIRSFRTDAGFSQIMLADGYPIEAWFNDREVDEFSRNFILSLTSTFTPFITPFVADLPDDDEVVVRSNRIIGMYDNQSAIGLTYTYLLDGLGISFLTGHLWDTHEINITMLEELPDEDDVKEFNPTVPHISDKKHLIYHHTWILKRIGDGVGNGSVLLTKLGMFYPHLAFSNDAKKQIKTLKGAMLRLVVNRLRDLENYCKTWDDAGGFDGTKIPNSSYESPETMAQFGRDREFKFYDGETRLCSYHLKGKVENQLLRIHIWADVDGVYGVAEDGKRKILVGYIGDHLPTVNDPT